MTSTSLVTFATYNAHRVFDSFDDPETNDGKPKSERSLNAAANVIKAGEADVIALQEIENIDMLRELQSRGGLRESHPHLLLIEGHDRKGIDVALMSRFPVKHFESHRGSENTFRRPLLEAEITLPDKTSLNIFVGHFIAKMSEWCDHHRLREAAEAQSIVSERMRLFPENHFVFLGDLNDTEDSATLQTVAGTSLYDATAGTGPTWGEVWPTELPSAKLDHILVSESLNSVLVSNGVLHHPEDRLASDHRLLRATFDLARKQGRTAA